MAAAKKTPNKEKAPDYQSVCQCEALRFEGPISQGYIVNGDLVIDDLVYRCISCGAKTTVDAMKTQPVK